jgi:hypothetical protein
MSNDTGLRARTPKALYRHRTRIGSVHIAPCRGGWEIQHDGSSLGSPWPTPEDALAELVAGRTRLASHDVDPSTLGLASSLEQWERLGWVTGP